MSSALKAIHQELQRLQNNGHEAIFLDNETLQNIQSAVNAQTEPNNKTATQDNKDLQAAASILTELLDPKSTIKPQKVKTPVIRPPLSSETNATATNSLNIKLPKDLSAKEQLKWLTQYTSSAFPKKEIIHTKDAATADILICGEAPNDSDTKNKEIFSGPSGELLNKILKAMGLAPEQAYRTTLVKWNPHSTKPYGNQPPSYSEMQTCLPILKAEIEIIKPKVIIALGKALNEGLFGPNFEFSKNRGSWTEFAQTPTLPTFQLTYIIRNNTDKTKRAFWLDMLKVMERANIPISDKQKSYFLPKQK